MLPNRGPSVHELIRRLPTQVTVAPGNVEKGAKIFKTKCAQCHNADNVRPAHLKSSREHSGSALRLVQSDRHASTLC
jgi:cytochrome c2